MRALSPDDRILTTHIVRELRAGADALGIPRDALERVKYRTVYNLILDGRVPAEKVGQSWGVRRRDLPTVANALGLTSNRRPGRPRQDSATPNAAAA